MAFIQQSYLFSLQDLLEMDQENRFEAIYYENSATESNE
jgi:hypothetical protein